MISPDETFLSDLLNNFPKWFDDESRLSQARMTANLFPYRSLFSPIQINQLVIKNRIVMGPMGNISMAEEMGRPSNKMIQYFTERARGGVGLITSGLIPVSQSVDPTVTEPGDRSYFPRIDRSRTVFSGWRELAENIHSFGARFFIQLTPGLGRVGSPETLLKKYRLPISASWNPNFYIPSIPCRPLTDAECKKIIRAMGQASADAKALLIDGVYLHGHEGYLLEQMTNPAFNRRLFGRYANWQNFGLDLIKEIRRRVGDFYPIMYRIDLSLALHATYGDRMNTVNSLRKFGNERTVAMTLEYMTNLVKAGVDLFDVDLGSYDNWWLPHPPNSIPSGCYLPVARLVKQYFEHTGILSNTGHSIPVVAVGKLGYPDLAEKALRDGDCDMIMLARPLLADPEWPNKVFARRHDEITPCIGDQEACINEFIEGGHPQCSVNPRTGFEDVYPRILIKTTSPKNIAVIGSGPGGIQCAVTLARRGHQVTLYEKNDRIGGMLVPGSVPKIKFEIKNYLISLQELVHQCMKDHRLEVNLDTQVDVNFLKSQGYESIVIAVGSQLSLPAIPGIDNPIVTQAVDLFRNPPLVNSIEQVVIIGGGSVGCECAHFLASEYNKSVTIIEMLPALMIGQCTANRGHLIHEFERLQVKLRNCSKAKSIQDHSITILRNKSKSVPDPYNTWNPLLPDNVENPLAKKIHQEFVEEILPADLIVLAVGAKPDFSLYDECVRTHAAPEIHVMGDCFSIGGVFEAVKAGYMIGNAI